MELLSRNNVWFNTDSLSVPINVDVNFFGAKYIDSFCWNLFNDYSTVDEFAWYTCEDLNLPSGFRHRIALQIIEQIDSYRDLILSAKYCCYQNEHFIQKFQKSLLINICIRKDLIEYTDKISWNLTLPVSKQGRNSPELFAQSTIIDLGLPIDMEPVLIFKIYEALFRHLSQSIEVEIKHVTKSTITTAALDLVKVESVPVDSSDSMITSDDFTKDKVDNINDKAKCNQIKDDTDSFISSEFPTVKLCAQSDFMNMVTDTWKKEKPSYIEERTCVPYALLPDDKHSNIQAWK